METASMKDELYHRRREHQTILQNRRKDKMDMSSEVKGQYVVVTAISSHRMRYVVPMSELQKLNEDCQVDPKWALDLVTMQEVKEFSQDHIGEQISDMFIVSEEEVLDLFDRDNEYASDWSRDYKIASIHHWEEYPSDERAIEFENIRQEEFKGKYTS